MLKGLWQFLGDPANRTILSWLGGGVAAAGGGALALFKLRKPKEPSDPQPGLSAKDSGIINYQSIMSNNVISTHTQTKPEK